MIKKIIYYFINKLLGGENIMAEFLAFRIADDKTTFVKVPKSLQISVAYCLVDLEAEDKIPADILEQIKK